MVKLDDIILFHAGDHAFWGGSPNPYRRQIDFLAEKFDAIDVMFCPVATGSGEMRPSITEGIYYAITKLRPKVIFPMHAESSAYEKFYEKAKKENFVTTIAIPIKEGDIFLYKNGRIKRM